MASDGNALTGIWFDGQKYFAEGLYTNLKELDLPVFEQTDQWLNIYFSGKAPSFTPLLKMKTTPFRKAVWKIMLTIPFGQTMTYGEIAERIAREKGLTRMSAQAVGGAVGHNAISLIILGQEVADQIAMRGIDLNSIKPGLFQIQGRISILGYDIFDLNL